MVLVLYRHALLNAVVAFPEARESVLENETWRKTSPQINSLRVLEGVPAPILARLEKEAGHSYYRAGSYLLAPGAIVDEGTLLFVLRGEARVLILDTEIATVRAGTTIGTHCFLKLPVVTNPRYEIIASAPTDALILHSDVLFEAMKDDRYEDHMKLFENASRVLAGGDILDAFGFKVDGADASFNTDCVETSEVLKACSEHFVAQLPALVEDVAFWPGEKIYSQGDEGDFMYFVQAGRVRLEALGRIKHEVVKGGATLGDMACLEQVTGHTETAVAETHVWVRALHRKLIRRALQAFPEEERALLGSASQGAGGVFEGG
jgi:CRP-like cAMP-binding protein